MGAPPTIDRTVVPVARLTRREQFFRCEPFSAVITVKACLARQGATYMGGRMRGHVPTQHAAHPECARCELGATVMRRVPATVSTLPKCSVDGCNTRVPDAGRRKPLCERHR
jgi:hypothetical protein